MNAKTILVAAAVVSLSSVVGIQLGSWLEKPLKAAQKADQYPPDKETFKRKLDNILSKFDDRDEIPKDMKRLTIEGIPLPSGAIAVTEIYEKGEGDDKCDLAIQYVIDPKGRVKRSYRQCSTCRGETMCIECDTRCNRSTCTSTRHILTCCPGG